jgi:hypothetical protein
MSYSLLVKLRDQLFFGKVKVERFRVQSSGLKNPQPTHIKGILNLSCLWSRFTEWGMSGIPDLDQYGEQFPSLVTFEP